MMGVLDFVQAVCFVLLCLALLLRGLAYFLRDIQNQLLYYPGLPQSSREYVEKPSALGFPFWEELQVVSEESVRLHGYFLKQPNGLHRLTTTIVYFHGNAGNIGHRLPICVPLYKNFGYNVIMVDYRGYGLSEGVPSEEGLKADARAVLQYVHTLEIDRSRVIVMGTSLGGAVAAYLAVTQPSLMCGVIVENTFTSISDMADIVLGHILKQRSVGPTSHRVALWLFTYTVKPLVLMLNWNTLSVIAKITHPILFVSGRKDELVPPLHMNMLYSKATRSSRKAFVPIPLGSHNETWACQGYFESLHSFVEHNAICNPNTACAPLQRIDMDCMAIV
jgi:fermentation-respiration switch protein FrsA (DUF1100 family)